MTSSHLSFHITDQLLRLAWTGRADIPSIIPILSGGLFGFSFVLTMVCRSTPCRNNQAEADDTIC